MVPKIRVVYALYAIVRAFCVVASMFLGRCLNVWDGCQVVALRRCAE